MAKSEEKLKSLLMNAKDESEKSGLKLNIQKAKIMDPSPITSWQVVVQLHSCVRLFATSWTATHLAFLSLTISWSFPKFMSIASVMPSSHLILWHSFLLPSIFPSIRDFSNELAVHIRWPKYWSFSISPSNEYSWLISLKIDCFSLLAVQGTLRSLLQHHSLKALILQCSAFFTALRTVCNHWEDH